MGRKIFVSYKYSDSNVQSLRLAETSTARHYVDVLQNLLGEHDHMNKGEADDESLDGFKDNTIASKLRDKIYDSSITVVVISRSMKEGAVESEQWIPWEIAYSLREKTRNGRTSGSNAVLAVVLPDQAGQYDYYIKDESCPHCKCRTLRTDFLFGILKRNMFNARKPEIISCEGHEGGGTVYSGHPSYIHSVKWADFQAGVEHHIGIAESIRNNVQGYTVSKEV